MKFKLKEIATVVGGATPSTEHEEYYNGDIIWITPKDLSNNNGNKFIEKGERNITKAGFDASNTKLIPPYNILISTRAPIGYIAINKKECCTNQGFKSLICDKTKVNVDYLYYALQMQVETLEKLGTGTTFKEVSKDAIEKFEIELPELTIQNKIASILSLVDNQIQRNNDMVQKLQVLAQSTYSRWFNQFEFPNEDGLPYKSNGGKFEYNEELKREIPIGWEVKELGGKNGITKCVLGGTPSRNKEKYWNGNINWINSGEVANFPITDTIEKITQEGLDNSATELMNKGSIIISITGNIRTSINAIDCCANQSVVGVYEKDNFLNSYLYFLIKENEQFYIKQMTGAVQKHINKEVVEKTKVLIPSETILIKYNQIVCHIIKQIISISMEAQELNSLKSRLLPLLINGQLEV